MGEKEREQLVRMSQKEMSEEEHDRFEEFLKHGNEHLEESEYSSSRPWTTCFITFLNMLQAFGYGVGRIDCSKPFRIVIDYDPEQARVAIRHYQATDKSASEPFLAETE